MMKFYPSFNNIFNDFKSLAGNQSGILEASAMPLVNFNGEVKLKSITGNMPKYHKTLLSQDMDIQYHIIGYGSHYEEALIKYTGESIERYSTIVAPELVKDKIVFSSYKELSKKGKVLPLEYLNVFTENQRQYAKELHAIISEKEVNEDDIIGWIKCPSLFKKNEEIWVPAKMMFVGYKENKELNEVNFIPSFSTGTASHKSLKKALINSLVEYIQIDAFMLTWYTKIKCKRVKIDNELVNNLLEEVNLGKDSSYEIIPIYMTLDEIPLPNFGVILKRKDKGMPYITFGVQGGLDPVHSLTRGIMEAASIAYGPYFSTVYNPDGLKHVMNEDAKFLDLDSNVLFYAAPNKHEEKDNIMEEIIEGEILLSSIENYKDKNIDEQISFLLKHLSKVSEYGVYLDITPPETRNNGWYVTRVLLPEILEMCIPEFPFANHPRMKKYGGVKNGYPHPMP
ncbi:YcaO-like family protein [Clostridium tarantellae]|uniref:Streptolysin associated protein SagD n=1 Tax=Clostridium tarantellae TaxID=39493 RepID=A0A6I1MNV2_9CLOT|nr:YcaO-like family protein [Clostridium tarantellae]MPQ43787.1 streptolysin associated protein SagD [Clostridium tarantellae]